MTAALLYHAVQVLHVPQLAVLRPNLLHLRGVNYSQVEILATEPCRGHRDVFSGRGRKLVYDSQGVGQSVSHYEQVGVS